ncbi:MAG TPA: beta-propeller fold lactonase family protein [Solirubrobacteraceae bacterium]|nr:beta-propeller fold lactonase family protein [Solirubrobacteraceae bacterium]
MTSSNGGAPVAIYVQSNDAAANEVLAFARAADGRLGTVRRYATGGRGTGMPHLPSQNPLSADDADPAQVAFSSNGRTLVVTERGTDSISAYTIGEDGRASGPATVRATGKTPYGFDFTPSGSLVVTEAFGGAVGAAAVSSYSVAEAASLAPVSGSVGDTRSEVCWAAVTNDGRFAYVTDFGDGTISSYAVADDGGLALREPVAGSTRLGEKGVRDEALTDDGRFLYAIDADARKVFGWAVGGDGTLETIGAFEGLPETVAGLAAS